MYNQLFKEAFFFFNQVKTLFARFRRGCVWEGNRRTQSWQALDKRTTEYICFTGSLALPLWIFFFLMVMVVVEECKMEG